MKLPGNYNKDLDITIEQIQAEDNVDQLHSWRNSLQLIMDEVLRKNLTDDWHTLPPRAKAKYQRTEYFDKVIARRIGCVFGKLKAQAGYQSERSRRKDRTLVAKFMEVAKRELPKEEYKRLLALAQDEISKENT